MMKDWQRIALNTVAFNVGWFSCVLAARWGTPLAAAPVILGVLLLHLLVTIPLRDRRGESCAIICVALLGTGIDTINYSIGILGFAGSIGLFTPWIACFWLNFGTTLNTALRWLAPRPVLAGTLGVVSAPGTYYFGATLGALNLHESVWLSMLVLAAEWFVLLPVMALIARRLRWNHGDVSGIHPASSGGAATAPKERPAS